MFKQNHQSFQSFEKSELPQVNHNSSDSKNLKIIEYRQPEVYYLGELETVQGNYSGSQTDAGRNFYYN